MLARLAGQGKGPVFIPFSKFRLAKPEHLDEWAAEVLAKGCAI
jgi:hypothetical protein